MTPEHILRTLRKRRRLEEEDTSVDDSLENMKPMDKLRECVAWEIGDVRWADRILYLADQCGVVSIGLWNGLKK